MSYATPVREMTCYHESGRRFGVSERQTKQIFGEAADQVGRIVGGIRLVGFEAISFANKPEVNHNIHLLELPYDRTEHVALLTQRRIVNPANNKDVAGIALLESHEDTGCIANTTFLVRKIRGHGFGPTVDIAKHELAHTFRLKHCTRSGCIMNPGHDIHNYKSGKTQMAFCDCCLNKLERAGHRARARLL